MNEKRILQNSIEQHQKVIDEAKEQLAKLDITYSAGDRFTFQNGRKAMLTSIGYNEVIMITLDKGTYWGNTRSKFNDVDAISESEFAHILQVENFKRYWDNRKQVRCD